MIEKKEFPFDELRNLIKKQRDVLGEINKYASEVIRNKYDPGEKALISSKIDKLKENLEKRNNDILERLKGINLPQKLALSQRRDNLTKEENPLDEEMYSLREDDSFKSEGGRTYKIKELFVEGLEKETLKRLRESKKKISKIKNSRNKKKSGYSETASKVFSKFSKKLLGGESFKNMEKDLIKANLDYSPTGYISLILFTTLLSFIVGGFLFMFFLFFNIEATAPFVTRTLDTINIRFLKVFWLLFAVPIGTFVMMYFYPSLEKKAAEFKIDVELPFATIHMAAISGSMINPIKIFEILILTKEYKALEKEFTKLLNEINIYGVDFVSALKDTADHTPSKALAELLNGLATTINSGGDLPNFFEKRSETLLFDYRLQREKATKAAETFMDIYISVVIAAPMILMLLLMMMKISGLGLSASIGTITLVMILGVVVINIIFLSFLHLKKNQ
jgi:archaeal flagellar protein FlaJ